MSVSYRPSWRPAHRSIEHPRERARHTRACIVDAIEAERHAARGRREREPREGPLLRDVERLAVDRFAESTETHRVQTSRVVAPAEDVFGAVPGELDGVGRNAAGVAQSSRRG